MNKAALFPDAYTQGRQDRIEAAWDLSWPLPVPKVQPVCPLCPAVSADSAAMALKDWKFHQRTRTGSANPYRCDVRMKCMSCSAVQIFGVVVPRRMWDHAFAHYCRANQWITWRQGRKILTEAGFFGD